MSRCSKYLVFAIFGFFLVEISGHFISSDAQAFQVFHAQLNAPQTAPNLQGVTNLNLQPLASASSQPQALIEWIKKYPSIGVLPVVVLLYCGVLVLRPRWLLWLPLDKIPKTPFSPEIPVPSAIASLLKYRPRVLDAWVDQRIAQAETEFEQRRTVKERCIYIPIPVELNGKKPAIANFNASDLRAVFSKQAIRLEIVGEGGVGKTSLACQIAKWAMAKDKTQRLCKHRMLPVLIEEELDIEAKSPLLEAIARQIKNLRDEEKPVSEELLKQLLEKRRILVIVDHLSEMGEATRRAIRLKDPNSPINALVVTARIEEILGKEVTQTTIRPQRVSGNQLSIFMDAYLTQRNKRDLFDDPEYFDALRRLSQIVTDERDVTVLFAKLYADQMIAVAEGRTTENLPGNVPDLMLNYINEVNREKNSKIEDEIIQHDLKIIAWECLKRTFKPEMAEREQVIRCLAALEGEDDAAKKNVKERLKYLEDRLALILTVPPAKTKLRFALDPLAEYLASLYLVDLYGADERKWQSFLEEVRNKPSTLEESRGFLLALRDCCAVMDKQVRVIDFVVEELGRLAFLDLEALAQEHLRQRIRNLTSDLSRVDARDRIYAAKELGNIGSDAKAAIPSLISRVLKDEDVSVRKYSAEAVRKIGLSVEADYLLLAKALHDLDEEVCIEVIGALTIPENILEGITASLITILRERVQFPRDESGLIKRRVGLLSTVPNLYISTQQALMRSTSVAVPTLLECLKDKNPGVRDVVMGALQLMGSRKKIAPYTKLASLALVEVLDSGDVDDRRGACFALHAICPVGEESISAELTEGLQDKGLQDSDPLIRVMVARILIEIKPVMVKHLVPKLVSELNNEDSFIRSLVCISLGDAPGDTNLATQVIIPALEAACDDPEQNVRQAASEALNKFRIRKTE